MKENEDFSHYYFSAIGPDGAPLAEVNPHALIETASAIKSPLACVALRSAAGRGHDVNNRTVAVRGEHIPDNATTFMRHLGGQALTLGELVGHAVIYSDATATNMLIDYIGGRDSVNRGLRAIGLDQTELLQEKLDIVELQSPDSRPVFGRSTARELAEYYHRLWNGVADQPWMQDFMNLHTQADKVRFFSTRSSRLQPGTSFHHKTGSLFSTDIPQATIVDAGYLQSDKLPYGVSAAAALMTYREDGLSGLHREFSDLNCQQLGIDRDDICDHPLGEKVA